LLGRELFRASSNMDPLNQSANKMLCKESNTCFTCHSAKVTSCNVTMQFKSVFV